MKKKRMLTVIGVLLTVLAAQAQTTRKFTIDLTDDGKAKMTCYIPSAPSGMAIVGIPGGGYSVFSDGADLVLPDGIHPNGKGAERLATIVSEAIGKKM